MAIGQTTNYNLQKPDKGTTDWHTYVNGNMDIIDTTMKANADSIGNKSNLTTISKTDLVTALNELNSNKVLSKSANYTLQYSDRGIIAVTTASNTITITLPSATTAQVPYLIKKVDNGSGSVTIATTASQLIDGVSTKTLTYQNAFIAVVSDGTGWQVIDYSTNLTSTNGDITVGGTQTSPTVTLNSGTGANQIVKRDANGNILNMGYQITPISINTTLTPSQSGIIMVTTGSSAITVTLPNAVGNAQLMYTIKKADSGSGTVTIATTASQTIDGVSTKTLTNQYANITVVSDGANWVVDVHNDYDKIGLLSNLTTTVKSDLVSAVNEVKSGVNTNTTNIATNTSNIGTLSNLGTTAKTDLVSAINEVQQIPTFTMSRQAIINGNFDVWQRGTSFTNPSSGQYTADRYVASYSSTGTLPTTITHSRQQLTPGDIPNSFWYYRINTNGAGSGFGANDNYTLIQKIENGTRNLCGSGKKITITFYARSDIAGKRLGVNAAQIYGSGGSPSITEALVGQIITLTSTWTKYTVTLTTNTLVGKVFGTNYDDTLNINFSVMFGSSIASTRFGTSTTETFGGAGNIDIAQLQVNAGDQPLPFQPRDFATELALCQRYYEKSYDYVNPPATVTQNGYNLIGIASNADNVTTNIAYRVKKRVVPTVTFYHSDGTSGSVGKTILNTKVTGLSIALSGEQGVGQLNKTAGFTTGDVVMAHWTADAEL
jgi:hypothetical protein